MNTNVEFPENRESFEVGFNSTTEIHGKDGEDGVSPTVTTEETNEGIKVTITDVNGTTSATVKHGKDGDKGDPGHTPVIGVDYFTPEEKATFVKEVELGAVGDIDTALDSIIAIQNTLIGGRDV